MSSEQEKDMGRQGQEDIAKGKMKQAAGKVQGKFGEVTSDKEAEVKGAAKQAEGATQARKGKAEREVDEALDRSQRDE